MSYNNDVPAKRMKGDYYETDFLECERSEGLSPEGI